MLRNQYGYSEEEIDYLKENYSGLLISLDDAVGFVDKIIYYIAESTVIIKELSGEFEMGTTDTGKKVGCSILVV